MCAPNIAPSPARLEQSAAPIPVTLQILCWVSKTGKVTNKTSLKVFLVVSGEGGGKRASSRSRWLASPEGQTAVTLTSHMPRTKQRGT